MRGSAQRLRRSLGRLGWRPPSISDARTLRLALTSRRPRNVRQYLPRHAWQLGNVHREDFRWLATWSTEESGSYNGRANSGVLLCHCRRKRIASRLIAVVAGERSSLHRGGLRMWHGSDIDHFSSTFRARCCDCLILSHVATSEEKSRIKY